MPSSYQNAVQREVMRCILWWTALRHNTLQTEQLASRRAPLVLCVLTALATYPQRDACLLQRIAQSGGLLTTSQMALFQMVRDAKVSGLSIVVSQPDTSNCLLAALCLMAVTCACLYRAHCCWHPHTRECMHAGAGVQDHLSLGQGDAS